MRKRRVTTNNRNLCNKINSLNFIPEVVIRDVDTKNIKRLLTFINKKNKVLEIEKIGEYHIVRKLKPLDFNIYFNKNK